MAKKCRPININEPVGEDYTRLRKCIADLYALVLPLIEPQETRPSKRTRTGLSVEEREARAAFQLMKDEKRKEIAEFMQNYKGPPYHPVEEFLWGTLCKSYDCPMGLEAFGHEIGKDCLLDPKEVWKLPPIEIILKPEAAKAYKEAEAALAEPRRRTRTGPWTRTGSVPTRVALTSTDMLVESPAN
jgi:hypothetical protein